MMIAIAALSSILAQPPQVTNEAWQEAERILRNEPALSVSMKTAPIQLRVLNPVPAGAEHLLGVTNPHPDKRLIVVFIVNLEKYLEVSRESPKFHKAMGRVIAHEVLHVLYPERGHWGHGLMAEHASRGILLSTTPVEVD